MRRGPRGCNLLISDLAVTVIEILEDFDVRIMQIMISSILSQILTDLRLSEVSFCC